MDEKEKIQILKDIIGFSTVNDHESLVANYLHQLFLKHGIESEVIEQFPGRSDIIATVGDGSHPIIGISGHEDTVHQGDESEWTFNPFTATVHNDKIFGRGTSDMKGALAQFAILLIEFKENPEFNRGTLKFIGTMSEELTEQGAAYLTDQGYVDDLDCLIVGEPTGVPISEVEEYFATGGATIHPDDLEKLAIATSNYKTGDEQHFIVTSHKGWMAYTVTSHGKAAHSSMPALGVNAISNLVDYYVEERKLYESLTESNPVLGKTVYSPGIFNGGRQVNSVPSLATEQVKVRTIPELPNDELISRLKELVNKLNKRPHFNLEIDIQFSEVPIVNHGENMLASSLKENSSANLNEPIDMPTIGVSYGTDASEFRRKNEHMEIVILGCGNTTAHRVDKYVTTNVYLSFNNHLTQALNTYVKNFSKVMN